MRIRLVLLFCSLAFVVNSQSSSEKIIGKWFVTGVHNIEKQDTVVFQKGNLNKDDYSEFIIWSFKTQKEFKQEIFYLLNDDSQYFSNEVMIVTFDVTWEYIEENSVLFANSMKYFVIEIDTLQMKLTKLN